jgi:hypothetical protein
MTQKGTISMTKHTQRGTTDTAIVNGLTVTYLTRLPATVPADRVIVHNHVRPTRRVGSRGLRAWLSPAAESLEVCDCRWAPELGRHYRPRTKGE